MDWSLAPVSYDGVDMLSSSTLSLQVLTGPAVLAGTSSCLPAGTVVARSQYNTDVIGVEEGKHRQGILLMISPPGNLIWRLPQLIVYILIDGVFWWKF